MGIVVYTLSISLDGYIEDATGGIDFSDPSEELHRHSNEQTRDTSVFLFGRGLYDVMEDYWTSPERANDSEVEAEFAKEYVATPRVVVSDSLTSVADGCRLVRRADAFDEVARMKRETDGVLAVGGAGLAASLLDLIDEFRITLVPAFIGGGKPYVPLGTDLRLRLAEHRVFDTGAVYLRYTRSS